MLKMDFGIIVVFATLCYASKTLARDSSYTAAVYEHIHRDPLGISGENGVKQNLAAFEEAARIAAENGADIIVFPEYGIISAKGARNKIAVYLENVPDPEEAYWNPCEQIDMFTNHSILTNLSCMARTNNISVVANMGAKEPCSGEGCPADNHYYLNTNVVFTKNGTLVARYYKQHLFLEDSYNVYPKSKIITFETNLGKFTTIICFDILFYPIVEIIEKQNVDSILFTTWWGDSHPTLSSIQVQESFAIRHNVTLLAANLHMPILGSIGSGIYTGKGAMVYTHEGDSASKILISKIGEPDSARIITQEVPNQWLPSKYSYKSFNLENYTLVEIVNSSGQLSACNRGLCCKLIYQTSSDLSESYYLAVVNGTRTDVPNRYYWCEEACLLIRCEDRFEDRCVNFPVKSMTVFSQFHLSGNFTTEYVYPNVLLTEMKLLNSSSWSYATLNDSVELKSIKPIAEPILSATLYGRCYDRDPLYRP